MSIWTHQLILPPNDEGEDPLNVQAEDSINYGTHTLPKKFWTSGKGSILHDEAFRARRHAKAQRTAGNKAVKAEVNRNGPSLRGRKL